MLREDVPSQASPEPHIEGLAQANSVEYQRLIAAISGVMRLLYGPTERAETYATRLVKKATGNVQGESRAAVELIFNLVNPNLHRKL